MKFASALFSLLVLDSTANAAESPSLRGGLQGLKDNDFANRLDIVKDIQEGRKLNIDPYNNRWKTRVNDVVQIPYVIDTNYFGATAIGTIENALRELSERTKVVNFVPRTSQTSYVEVSGASSGCWSYVGQTGGKQTVNLGSGCVYKKIIQHEFIHAAGLTHEQNRPDRDAYVTINWSNIPEKNRHNFEIATTSTTLGSAYEYGSAMHYTSKAFAIDSNFNTITPKQSGVTLGNPTEATNQDVLKLRLLYQCKSDKRTLSSYNSNRCTSDCPCWEGEIGCNGNNDACQGNLVCANNQCVEEGTTGCTDEPNWTDSYGDGCDWYENTPDGCADWGTDVGPSGTNANQACCVCRGGGGGGGGGGCTNVPGWTDSWGDGCAWYENTSWGCDQYGMDIGPDGRSANSACCVCGGGSMGGPAYVTFTNDGQSNYCLDLAFADTTNANNIILYPCNGTPAQKWWLDFNGYLRSALDNNKCIVGSSGDTSEGTNLMIYDCFTNDSRFMYTYSGDTLRPKNNGGQCATPSSTEILSALGKPKVELSGCSGSANQFWTVASTNRRVLRANENNGKPDSVGKPQKPGKKPAVNPNKPDRETGKPTNPDKNCRDIPNAWYDINGNNCAWYAESTNCVDFGAKYKNFGKTANQACCACGGGNTPGQGSSNALEEPLEEAACYDFADWYDTSGDSCAWYAQADNCDYYGAHFGSDRGPANVACCACGGGTDTPPPKDNGKQPVCSNSPSNWVDDDGDDCSFYAIDNNCEKFGDDYIGRGGKTANEACCACGGGNKPGN